MHGVMKNIAYLCKRNRSKIWGKDGWKKVVACIVSDGHHKEPKRRQGPKHEAAQTAQRHEARTRR